MTCNVCCSDFTKVLRKEITCPYCNFSGCTECTKRYVLQSTADINCMNCKVPWNSGFISSIFTKAFLNGDYKQHREKVLLDREKSKIVATLPLAENEKKNRIMKEELNVLKLKKDNLVKEIENVNLSMLTLKRQMRNNSKENTSSKKVFTHPCVNDGCRGFLDSRWVCGLCDVRVCSHCFMRRDEGEHTCDPNNVESAKLIKKSSRSCPSCSAAISKIDGCDQMWCPVCKTAFSYNTGQIETGNIHNPHFYEYMKTQGDLPRNIGDVPCGGLPSVYAVMRHLKKMGRQDHVAVNVLRCLSHIQNYEIPRYTVMDHGADLHVNLRIEYILNDITEEQWKKKLHTLEKQINVSRNIRLIFDMVTMVGIDLLAKVMTCHDWKELDDIEGEFDRFREYINKSFKEHSKTFHSTRVKVITDQWFVESVPN